MRAGILRNIGGDISVVVRVVKVQTPGQAIHNRLVASVTTQLDRAINRSDSADRSCDEDRRCAWRYVVCGMWYVCGSQRHWRKNLSIALGAESCRSHDPQNIERAVNKVRSMSVSLGSGMV